MDKSAIAIRIENKILDVLVFAGLDTQELAGEVIRVYRDVDARWVNVDDIGIGAGVTDELKQHKDISWNAVNVSMASEVMDDKKNRRFANLRAELWWSLREALDPKKDFLLGLPPRSRSLLADLAAPLYSPKRGYIQIEDKEETKKRLGRSPDEADAVMLTFAPLTRKPMARLGVKALAKEQKVVPKYRIPGYYSSR
jgi:phage terminase large subunit